MIHRTIIDCILDFIARLNTFCFIMAFKNQRTGTAHYLRRYFLSRRYPYRRPTPPRQQDSASGRLFIRSS